MTSATAAAIRLSVEKKPTASSLIQGLRGQNSAGFVPAAPAVQTSPTLSPQATPSLSPFFVPAAVTVPVITGAFPQWPVGPIWRGSPDASVFVTLPSPIPAGVPASGIFKPSADRIGGDSGILLSVDAVAADLSTLGSARVDTREVAAAASGTSLAINQGPIAAPTPGSAPAIQAPAAAPGPTLGQSSADAVNTKEQERAVLPDLAAVWPAAGSVSPRPSRALPDVPANQDGLVTPADVLAVAAKEPVAAANSVAVLTPVDADSDETAKTLRRERLIVVGLAIYGAACVTIGVAAPGLTSLIRRRKRRSQ
jgi:hypothetical protein